jgi:hypothetical protein
MNLTGKSPVRFVPRINAFWTAVSSRVSWSLDVTNKGKASMATEHSIEGQKLLFDTFKHLTTLTTGSILILVTFMKDVFRTPEWPILIGVTFGLLILSTVSSVVVMIILGHEMQKSCQPSEIIGNVFLAGVIVSWVGFLLGIITLVAFGMKNFY